MEKVSFVQGTLNLWVMTEEARRVLWCQIFKVCVGGEGGVELSLFWEWGWETLLWPVSSWTLVMQIFPKSCQNTCLWGHKHSETQGAYACFIYWPALRSLYPPPGASFSPGCVVGIISLVLCTWFFWGGGCLYPVIPREIALVSFHKYLWLCTVVFRWVCSKVTGTWMGVNKRCCEY